MLNFEKLCQSIDWRVYLTFRFCVAVPSSRLPEEILHAPLSVNIVAVFLGP